MFEHCTPLMAQGFSGWDGFLGSRASLMVDVVVVAMLVVVPVLAFSWYLVRQRQRYAAHKAIQITLGCVLLAAVLAFEVDLRFITPWRPRAEASPFFTEGLNWVWVSLTIHLFFAVPTLVLWVALIAAAWRKFPRPPAPAAHSRTHRFWGRLAAIGMTMTAVTGWIFYWLAFVAA